MVTILWSLDHSSSNTKVWSLFIKWKINLFLTFDIPYPKIIYLSLTILSNRLFADHFCNIFSNVRLIINFDFKAQYLQIVYNLHFNASYNFLFQLQELKRAISSLNPTYAMDSDLIHNLFLIHLPTSLCNILLDTINNSWVKWLLLPDYNI